MRLRLWLLRSAWRRLLDCLDEAEHYGYQLEKSVVGMECCEQELLLCLESIGSHLRTRQLFLSAHGRAGFSSATHGHGSKVTSAAKDLGTAGFLERNLMDAEVVEVEGNRIGNTSTILTFRGRVCQYYYVTVSRFKFCLKCYPRSGDDPCFTAAMAKIAPQYCPMRVSIDVHSLP